MICSRFDIVDVPFPFSDVPYANAARPWYCPTLF